MIADPKERGITIMVVGCGNTVFAQTVIKYIEMAGGHASLSDVNRLFHDRVAETKHLIEVLREDYEDIYEDIYVELHAEIREGWLKPQRKLKARTHSGNGMIDRLINCRARAPTQ